MGHAASQRVRKRIEEIFGWMKTGGGFRRTRYRGRDRTQLAAYFVGAAYNLLRMARLQTVAWPSAAVNADYEVPFRFTGTLNKVVIQIEAPKLTPAEERALDEGEGMRRMAE